MVATRLYDHRGHETVLREDNGVFSGSGHKLSHSLWHLLRASGLPIWASGRCPTDKGASMVAQCHHISLATAWRSGSSAQPDSITQTLAILSTYAMTCFPAHSGDQSRTAVKRLYASKEEMPKLQSVMPGP